MKSKEFWDNIFSQGQEGSYSKIELPNVNNSLLKKATEHFGNVENKILIDLGCGNGSTSLYFASLGAKVISIDISDVAINNLSKYCDENNIENISPIKLSANEIAQLGKVDFVFGSMILHHIEPFNEFSIILSNSLNQGGKCFFWENNARSSIMIWFRKNIVGKLWIPKYGDDDEFPLTLDEVNELRKHFHVKVEYPLFYFFRMIPNYLLRGYFIKPFEKLDNYLYKFPNIRKYSYQQYLFLSKTI